MPGTLHERHDPRRQQAPLLFTEIACAYSHIQCWRQAKHKDANYLIVFEDDAVICRSFGDIAMPVLYMPLDLQLIAHQRSMHGLGLSHLSGAIMTIAEYLSATVPIVLIV